jgi:hypothetical protein
LITTRSTSSYEFDGFYPTFFHEAPSRPSVVNRCDSQFHVIEEMSVPNYRKWLFHEYRILLKGYYFQMKIVERFFRIYGHGSHNERKPLTRRARINGNGGRVPYEAIG